MVAVAGLDLYLLPGEPPSQLIGDALDQLFAPLSHHELHTGKVGPVRQAANAPGQSLIALSLVALGIRRKADPQPRVRRDSIAFSVPCRNGIPERRGKDVAQELLRRGARSPLSR